jgi:hypothetical protein
MRSVTIIRKSKAAAVRDLPMSASLKAVIRCGENFEGIIVEDLLAGQGKTYAVPVNVKVINAFSRERTDAAHVHGQWSSRVMVGSLASTGA